MSNYRKKIAPGVEALVHAYFQLNESNSDLAHDVYCQLIQVENLLLNPFQTVPSRHFIHITTSLCDPDGNSDNAYDDVLVEFDREISAADLYIRLKNYISCPREGYYVQVSLEAVENWLNKQKALYRTVSKTDSGFIDESGMTVGDFKTDFGSIDFCMEYGIQFDEEGDIPWN